MATGAWIHNFPVSKDEHPSYVDWPAPEWDVLIAVFLHSIFTALDDMQDALGYDITGAFADLNTRLEQLDHATKAHGFYDRGDPAAYDFAVGDLTTDGNWHDLDLSGIASVGAKEVELKTELKSANPGDTIRYREKGNVNEINTCGCEALRANVTRTRLGLVACNAGRIIQYNADNVAWTTLNIAVRAWWIR